MSVKTTCLNVIPSILFIRIILVILKMSLHYIFLYVYCRPINFTQFIMNFGNIIIFCTKKSNHKQYMTSWDIRKLFHMYVGCSRGYPNKIPRIHSLSHSVSIALGYHQEKTFLYSRDVLKILEPVGHPAWMSISYPEDVFVLYGLRVKELIVTIIAITAIGRQSI